MLDRDYGTSRLQGLYRNRWASNGSASSGGAKTEKTKGVLISPGSTGKVDYLAGGPQGMDGSSGDLVWQSDLSRGGGRTERWASDWEVRTGRLGRVDPRVSDALQGQVEGLVHL